MIIFGTGGHATELLEELLQLGVKDIYFYNDVNLKLKDFYGHKVLKSRKELQNTFIEESRFVIGVGKPNLRSEKQIEWSNLGGIPTTVVSKNARIGSFEIELGMGLNIMSGVQISSRICIGDGCLINRNVNIHHDVVLGQFCEIGPNAVLLGGCQVGEKSLIGAGAILLPGVKVGQNCKVGAGSIVTKDIPDNFTVKGNPAK